MSRPTIFISYSHADEAWKDRLVTHLKVLQMQDLLDLWDDSRIGGGEDWYPEIQQAMDRACVAILLVSADFLSSRFILEEEVARLLQRRDEGGLHVFPVVVRPCAWKRVKWLSRMQLRPYEARPLSAGDEHQIDTDLAAIAEEVAAIVSRAERETEPGGYVPLGPEKISLAKLPSTHPDLFGREEELATLDAAWEQPQTHVLSLVAWGGVGKTALVNKWLLGMGAENYRGAERVFGYSFYSQGAREDAQASADPFIAAALQWFGDPDPTEGSPWDKGERLAERVRQQRTLLTLDGLEPLQHPPGEMAGRLKDPGLQCLLRELARHNSGLCVLTTRLEVDDLKEFVGSSVQRVPLEHLSPEAGAAYLRHLGVDGTEEELRQAVKEFGGHALALTLLGRYLAVVHGGDVRKRDLIPRLTQEQRQGSHAGRVMEAYERWFAGKPELDILRVMGLFDRPAEPGALAALRAAPPIAGLTERLHTLSEAEYRFAVDSLRGMRLLAVEEPPAGSEPAGGDGLYLDGHPLLREHFGEQVARENPGGWREGHNRLYEYYKAQAPHQPDTLEGMLPLYAAVAHGCRAGRHREAEKVYWERILRGNEFFSIKKLGALGSDLAALSGFFDPPWLRPVDGLRAYPKNARR